MAAASIPRPRARRTKAGVRVRWERLSRLAMLAVLAVLIYLYVSAGVRMLSTWHQLHADRATVSALQREHRALVDEHESLGRRGTIEDEARMLGMMRRGEQQYIVTGLPHD